MVARLVAEEGDLKGLILSLDNGDSWIIGRDPEECQLVIQDPLTSRKHLVARRTNEGILVENLSQTNPIQINEEEIGSQPRLLQQGDTVKIGNEIFRYYTDTSAHILDESLPSMIEDPTESDPAIERGPEPNSPLINGDKNSELEHPETQDQDVQDQEVEKQEAREEDKDHDTIFDDDANFLPLAEINFGIVETGRWLLKVIGGPNNGAEFYMQAGHSYILGTDPHSCDIVFHDTSVSRQHAKITVTAEDSLTIEDLKSRNGVLISGTPLEGKQTLSPSVIVTMGTTSFVVYDREGEMQTIISPLLPSIVKVLQQEETPKVEEVPPASQGEQEPISTHAPTAIPEPAPAQRHFGPLILLSIITGLFLLAGIGTFSLFKSEPIITHTQENATQLIQQAVDPFPAIRYSFNKSTGGLLLLGHVSTAADKNQLLYNLQGLKFIKFIDDTGIVIDEYVWQEVNSILANNPAWKGITIHSPAAGQFVLSGYLETRKQAEQLSDYISVNFPYLDLLKRQIVVEEDVVNQINVWLQDANLRNITAKMSNGEVTLTGNVPADRNTELNEIMTRIKGIPGVRIVNNFARTQAPEMGIINISNRYEITGQSRLGDKYTVVINGRILSSGDVLDGMTITQIKPNTVFLEKDGTKYRIDY
ncbi:type III secretion system inner membrane ring subunit SctD [Candidatus Protochlamydia phocaeensis]|uniref:type III secretion system inner membrane ring subunit SctD n=1 Tax=Candidatus Protochlamydia phocaeensis TaxID=1414722 RepID=UPI00083941AF|nr:type III secretion system inner membrane ring subunit SctD [Candidatus Protochlamydia phocaeensis]